MNRKVNFFLFLNVLFYFEFTFEIIAFYSTYNFTEGIFLKRSKISQFINKNCSFTFSVVD